MKLFLLLLLLPLTALAATRDVPFAWTHDCLTTAGDSLDLDGDGTCELLTIGWRFYDEAGFFITAIPETGIRTHMTRYNLNWGITCHTMTAVMDHPITAGVVLESDPSNVGACFDAVPGNPKPPTVIN